MQTARVCNHAAACGSDCDCYPSRGTSAHAALRIRTRPPWRNASARANACGGKTADGAMRHMTGLTAFMSGGGTRLISATPSKHSAQAPPKHVNEHMGSNNTITCNCLWTLTAGRLANARSLHAGPAQAPTPNAHDATEGQALQVLPHSDLVHLPTSAACARVRAAGTGTGVHFASGA